MSGEEVPPFAALMQLISGSWLSQAVHVAAKLGLADLLADGPRPAGDLAQEVGADAGAVYRVLRALASVGVFREAEPGSFELTPVGNCLRTGTPESLRAVAIMFGESWSRAAWTDILHSVKTGRPAFEHVFGAPFFSWLKHHPEAAAVFDEAMTDFSHLAIEPVLAAYDFAGVRKLVDVAGGHGSLLAAILNAHPSLQGVLFDLPGVIEGARQRGRLNAALAAGRCQLASGDFFESVPAGGDAYLLKHIIHDWSDERAAAILRSCRRAVAPQGRLLLVEMVIPPGNQPYVGKLLDLEMLVMTQGGRERTEAEFRTLLAAGGFRLTQVVPTRSAACIIEGVPA